jgi:23S rRNA pseudouridine1911/1915/1917 synthase
MELSGLKEGEPRVVYEDESLVAICKPSRMHCAPGRGAGDLCEWTFARYPGIRELGSGLGERRGSPGEGGLLHRLDYETSGLVLFARNPEAFASLLDQQARNLFHKEYIALCSPSRECQPRGSRPIEGFPGGVDRVAWAEARERLDSATLSGFLSEAPSRDHCFLSSSFRPFGPKGARVACLEAPGAGDKGLYRSEILECSPKLEGGPLLALRVGLARGFRHQIRAQLAWIGLPISGDPLYGREDDERLRLYAVRLSFSHPKTGLPVSIAAEPR